MHSHSHIDLPGHVSRDLYPSRPRPRVLVVEDDVALQTIFERIVNRVYPDLGLDWATNVPEAMQALNHADYELVVADYLLDENGTGVSIRDWCQYHRPGLCVAMMSSRVSWTSLPQDWCAVHFLQKPFTPGQLREFLSQLLRPLD